MRPTHSIISITALKTNIKTTAALTGGSFMLVVKADAYALGLKELIKFIHNMPECHSYAVAISDEGVALRQWLHNLANHKDIVVMEGFFDGGDLALHQEHQLIPVVHEPGQLEILKQDFKPQPGQPPFRLWLKYNSGMNRVGFSKQQLHAAWDWLKQQEHLRVSGIMTHFAAANRADCSGTLAQIQQFKDAVTPLWAESSSLGLPLPVLSLCNSAGIVAGFAQQPFAKLPPATDEDRAAANIFAQAEFLSRPGIMVYGGFPLDNSAGYDLKLEPVIELKTRLMAVRQLQAGERVGYEGSWSAPTPCLMGLAPIGYADGYPFADPQKLGEIPVLVKGKRCSLGGRVSMDILCLDLSNCPEAKVGDEVELWGKNLPLNEVAAAQQCPNQKLLATLTRRIHRIYI